MHAVKFQLLEYAHLKTKQQMKQQSQKKQQEIGEASSSLQKHLLGPSIYPLAKKNLTAITMAIFTGEILSK